MKNFFNTFFSGVIQITQNIDESKIDKVIETIKKIRLKKGRIFFLGVGGSAANCSHAVNDFRKLCNIECYTPSDNVSELTARINDEGWDTSYSNWLKNCNLKSNDGINFFFLIKSDNWLFFIWLKYDFPFSKDLIFFFRWWKFKKKSKCKHHKCS